MGLFIFICDSKVFFNGVGRDVNEEFYCDIFYKWEVFGDVNMLILKENLN